MKQAIESHLVVGAEAAYDTAVVPSRSYEFRTEGLTTNIEAVESQGIRKGQRLARSDRWRQGQTGSEGDITGEVGYTDWGLWLLHCLGAVATSQPDAVGNPTVFEHRFTPGSLIVPNRSLTAQVEMEDLVKTFTGCVVGQWTLEQGVNDYATLAMSLLARRELLGQAAVAVDYPANQELLFFTDAVLLVGGQAVTVNTASLQGNNQLDGGRYALGSRFRRQPAEPNKRAYTGGFNADFDDFTLYNRYVNGDEAQLQLTWTGPVISGAFNHALVVTANIRTDGQTPTVGGLSEIRQEIAYTVVDPGAATDLEILYRTTDSAP